MNVEFIPAASKEAEKAADYYDQQQDGLGGEFADELESALKRITNYPDACGLHSHGTRLCRMKRFPYGVVFKHTSNTITVVAVMHLHRKPGYWARRLKE